MKILIIGTSGTGKTYLANEFGKKGVNAFDADEIDGLHGWYNWKRERVRFPDNAGPEFLENHEFLWDKKFLEDFLKQYKDVYFFGNSGNVLEVKDLFDKVYFLDVPEEVIVERLDHHSRENPMGQTDYQKQKVIEWQRYTEKIAKEMKAETINGALSAEEIFNLIVK
ncbi:MAG: hypothetical protein A3B38_00825 [Candidatus Levybacteria bacterium RIFCSPLOWO2_01_FULL_36_13]|nr:MAG: hypothetical protein A2684_02065 [Candidatus Levybacteria bacterium RIFCSPHIGHO2_01_FULL_36_15b]OGH35432.1 MAG: hypothetical protein A3B38_00825 [Candidatus Levybacteria bacterium RIFCSPLOWO2_01_FULL_36_13]